MVVRTAVVTAATVTVTGPRSGPGRTLSRSLVRRAATSGRPRASVRVPAPSVAGERRPQDPQRGPPARTRERHDDADVPWFGPTNEPIVTRDPSGQTHLAEARTLDDGSIKPGGARCASSHQRPAMPAGYDGWRRVAATSGHAPTDLQPVGDRWQRDHDRTIGGTCGHMRTPPARHCAPGAPER